MPGDPYCASYLRRWTGGVIKTLFFKTDIIQSHQEATLHPPCSSLTHCLKLMAGSTAKSSQCDNVIWSQSERERVKDCCISAAIYTDYTGMRKWSKNKNKWRMLDDITDPRLLTAVSESYPDGYEARMSVGAETYCCPPS